MYYCNYSYSVSRSYPFCSFLELDLYINTRATARAFTPTKLALQSTAHKGCHRAIGCCYLSLLLQLQTYGPARQPSHMENRSPSSCISPAATSAMSAGESSWAMHIANFLASSPHGTTGTEMMDQEPAVSDGSFSSGFSSSFDSFDDDVSFITSELMCDDDDEDESLQDTACSSAAGQKISSMGNFDEKSMATMDAKEFNMPQLAKYFVDAGSQQHLTKVDQQAVNSYSNSDKALYESNELRKKGLCLVPVSMLINYLG